MLKNDETKFESTAVHCHFLDENYAWEKPQKLIR